MNNRNIKPKDCAAFALIGNDKKIEYFVKNFQLYYSSIILFSDIFKDEPRFPNYIVFKTRHGNYPVFSQKRVDGDTDFKKYDNQLDVDVVINFDLCDEYLNYVKAKMGCKRYHPVFVSYDKEMDLSCSIDDVDEYLINANVDFEPYIFIKELVTDVLPADMKLVASVSEKMEMLYLRKSNQISFFACTPRDVINNIASNLVEMEFKNDPLSFRFFTSEKNIKSIKESGVSCRLG